MKILLHTCCAPCSTACIQTLKEEGYEITLFFSNSNIFPESEFIRRKENAEKLAFKLKIPIVVDDYNHQEWLDFISGFENEPEKGKRCKLCFEFNLNRTSKYFNSEFDCFSTTLTVSPHKDSKIIFDVGKKYAGFECFDFKKKDGFIRSIELSKRYELYRQDYCGCEFSKS